MVANAGMGGVPGLVVGCGSVGGGGAECWLYGPTDGETRPLREGPADGAMVSVAPATSFVECFGKMVRKGSEVVDEGSGW